MDVSITCKKCGNAIPVEEERVFEVKSKPERITGREEMAAESVNDSVFCPGCGEENFIKEWIKDNPT